MKRNKNAPKISLDGNQLFRFPFQVKETAFLNSSIDRAYNFSKVCLGVDVSKNHIISVELSLQAHNIAEIVRFHGI